MTPINRALSVLDAYCARNGVPADHEVVARVREGIVTALQRLVDLARLRR
jgi:hypothetical protein